LAKWDNAVTLPPSWAIAMRITSFGMLLIVAVLIMAAAPAGLGIILLGHSVHAGSYAGAVKDALLRARMDSDMRTILLLLVHDVAP
jgi:hypothetical protein